MEKIDITLCVPDEYEDEIRQIFNKLDKDVAKKQPKLSAEEEKAAEKKYLGVGGGEVPPGIAINIIMNLPQFIIGVILLYERFTQRKPKKPNEKIYFDYFKNGVGYEESFTVGKVIPEEFKSIINTIA